VEIVDEPVKEVKENKEKDDVKDSFGMLTPLMVNRKKKVLL